MVTRGQVEVGRGTGGVSTNQSGDKVFFSKDGTRKIRFDLNNPSPHNSPHINVEELFNGKWKAVAQNYLGILCSFYKQTLCGVGTLDER